MATPERERPSLGSLPVEILLEIHIYLHAPVLPVLSRRLHDALRPSNCSTAYKARYILSRWFCNLFARQLRLTRKVYAVVQHIGNADKKGSEGVSREPLIFPLVKLPREKGRSLHRYDYEYKAKKASNYCDPSYLSLKRPISEDLDESPISYALMFVRGSRPEECLCSADVLHQVEDWVLRCRTLHDDDLANIYANMVIYSGSGTHSNLHTEVRQRWARAAARQKGDPDFSQLPDYTRNFWGHDDKSVALVSLRISHFPHQLIRRIDRECEKSKAGVQEQEHHQPAMHPDVLKAAINQLGEGPLPCLRTLELLLAVRFRYMGNTFQQPFLLHAQESSAGALTSISTVLSKRAAVWLVSLFFSEQQHLKRLDLKQCWDDISDLICTENVEAFKLFLQYVLKDPPKVEPVPQPNFAELARVYAAPWTLEQPNCEMLVDETIRAIFRDLIAGTTSCTGSGKDMLFSECIDYKFRLRTQLSWNQDEFYTFSSILHAEDMFYHLPLSILTSLDGKNSADFCLPKWGLGIFNMQHLRSSYKSTEKLLIEALEHAMGSSKDIARYLLLQLQHATESKS